MISFHEPKMSGVWDLGPEIKYRIGLDSMDRICPTSGFGDWLACLFG